MKDSLYSNSVNGAGHGDHRHISTTLLCFCMWSVAEWLGQNISKYLTKKMELPLLYDCIT